MTNIFQFAMELHKEVSEFQVPKKITYKSNSTSKTLTVNVNKVKDFTLKNILCGEMCRLVMSEKSFRNVSARTIAFSVFPTELFERIKTFKKRLELYKKESERVRFRYFCSNEMRKIERILGFDFPCDNILQIVEVLPDTAHLYAEISSIFDLGAIHYTDSFEGANKAVAMHVESYLRVVVSLQAISIIGQIKYKIFGNKDRIVDVSEIYICQDNTIMLKGADTETQEKVFINKTLENILQQLQDYHSDMLCEKAIETRCKDLEIMRLRLMNRCKDAYNTIKDLRQ
jgi:hypothetical protein